jgi:hypothetical protein
MVAAAVNSVFQLFFSRVVLNNGTTLSGPKFESTTFFNFFSEFFDPPFGLKISKEHSNKILRTTSAARAFSKFLSFFALANPAFTGRIPKNKGDNNTERRNQCNTFFKIFYGIFRLLFFSAGIVPGIVCPNASETLVLRASPLFSRACLRGQKRPGAARAKRVVQLQKQGGAEEKRRMNHLCRHRFACSP